MKNPLMAALFSAIAMMAVGCVNDGSAPGGFDPNIHGTIYTGPGYEVIRVNPIDPRPPILFEGAPSEPIQSCDGSVGGIVVPLVTRPDSVSTWPVELRAQARVEARPPGRLAHLGPLAAHEPTPSCQSLASEAAGAPSNPCNCADDECLRQWVDDNLGCNVCAVFTCGDREPHSCAPCS